MPFFNYTANQMNQRRYARLEDQFGRWWGAQIEKSTGDPCAEVSPVGGWNDPLNTPQRYLRPPQHEDGTTISGKIEVDFDRWMDSIRGSEDDWNQTIQVAGKETYKITTVAERRQWAEDPVLKAIAGPRPFPTMEMLVAARNGDRNLLGLATDVKTGTLHPETMTYTEFVSENRRNEFGKARPMAEVGKLWKEHRAFLRGEEVLTDEKDEVTEKVTEAEEAAV